MYKQNYIFYNIYNNKNITKCFFFKTHFFKAQNMMKTLSKVKKYSWLTI